MLEPWGRHPTFERGAETRLPSALQNSVRYVDRRVMDNKPIPGQAITSCFFVLKEVKHNVKVSTMLRVGYTTILVEYTVLWLCTRLSSSSKSRHWAGNSIRALHRLLPEVEWEFIFS